MVVSVYSQPHSPPSCAEDMGAGSKLASSSVPGHCSLVLVEGLCTLGLTPGWWQDTAVVFSPCHWALSPLLLAVDRGKVSCASEDTVGTSWPRAGSRAGLLGTSWVVLVQPWAGGHCWRCHRRPPVLPGDDPAQWVCHSCPYASGTLLSRGSGGPRAPYLSSVTGGP